jgi:hypothetical protein
MAGIISPNIVRDSLVLALDAADKNSYPGSGTSWYDLSGGYTGTLTNGPTFSAANLGSIVFDGINDYVDTNVKLLRQALSLCAEFLVFVPVKGYLSRPAFTGALIFVLHPV